MHSGGDPRANGSKKPSNVVHLPLRRASKRAVDKEGGADTGQSGATTAADTVLGVSGAMREWARKVKADPYTTNTVLRDALKSIAKVDTAGSIVTRLWSRFRRSSARRRLSAISCGRRIRKRSAN